MRMLVRAREWRTRATNGVWPVASDPRHAPLHGFRGFRVSTGFRDSETYSLTCTLSCAKLLVCTFAVLHR